MGNISIRQVLECRNEDGTHGFYAVDRVLLSPDLQERCTEKRALKRILQLIDQYPIIAKQIQARRATREQARRATREQTADILSE